MKNASPRFPIFDGHNDTLTRLCPDNSFFDRSERGHLDLPRANEGGMIGGLFAIFTLPPPESPEHDPFYGLTFTENGYDVSPRCPIDPDYAVAYTGAILQCLRVMEHDSRISLVRSYEDLQRNFENGVFSIVLHFEGAEAIRQDLSNLADYHAAGLRSLGLAWSRPNVFASGVPFRFPCSPDTGPGLTDAGKKLVEACNRLRILIDLAHLNEAGFWDVAQRTDAPLVVSHTGVHTLCPSTRNLTDAQIDAVGKSNGIIGVIFEPLNTRADGQPGADTPLTEIVRHIDYVVERIGVDHAAFGSDFDGAEISALLGDVAGLPRLIQALQDRGYDAESIEKIAYRNWFRVLKDTW